jgi:antitoxin (DNA-binding transcriptional repressor) of toxin-antitoxin stability system
MELAAAGTEILVSRRGKLHARLGPAVDERPGSQLAVSR